MKELGVTSLHSETQAPINQRELFVITTKEQQELDAIAVTDFQR